MDNSSKSLLKSGKKTRKSKKKEDKPQFSIRLAKKRKEAYKTQGAFVDAFDAEYRSADEEGNYKTFFDTYQKYEAGTSLPYKEDLLRMCDILGNCDAGYLLGIYDESTKDIHDLSSSTGLSESAIKYLQELSQATDAASRNKLNLINDFLTSDSGDDFLSSLEELEETLATIEYLKKLESLGGREVYDLENLYSWERKAKYNILSVQEEFQRYIYDKMGARSLLKELSKMINNTPAIDGPPPEEDQNS